MRGLARLSAMRKKWYKRLLRWEDRMRRMSLGFAVLAGAARTERLNWERWPTRNPNLTGITQNLQSIVCFMLTRNLKVFRRVYWAVPTARLLARSSVFRGAMRQACPQAKRGACSGVSSSSWPSVSQFCAPGRRNCLRWMRPEGRNDSHHPMTTLPGSRLMLR